jgi:argininosuccinate synthase
MNPVVVLAYDGEFDVAAAIRSIATTHGAAVVTLTVDVGQTRDLQATRDAALAGGASRAHVFDAVDEFARRCVLPAIQSGPASVTSLASTARLAYPVIAARLAEVAHLERTTMVAHGGSEQLTAEIRAVDPLLTVVTVEAPAVTSDGPQHPAVAARHLLQRPVADPAIARGIPANLVIEFNEAVPVSINGVALPLGELVESLSLLGGEHGIGYAEAAPAPAALVLETAYRALDRRSGVVCIELLDGQQRVLTVEGRAPELVNHA